MPILRHDGCTAERGVRNLESPTGEHSAELALWFGIHSDATLEVVLPNMRNFLSTSAAPPFGLLG